MGLSCKNVFTIIQLVLLAVAIIFIVLPYIRYIPKDKTQTDPSIDFKGYQLMFGHKTGGETLCKASGGIVTLIFHIALIGLAIFKIFAQISLRFIFNFVMLGVSVVNTALIFCVTTKVWVNVSSENWSAMKGNFSILEGCIVTGIINILVAVTAMVEEYGIEPSANV